jgi:hypothetical protein
LSKNALADLVLDFIQGEIGDGATDEEILAHLQPRLETIARLRGDKAPNLCRLLSGLDAKQAQYLATEEKKKADRTAQAAQEKALVEKIDQINKERLKTHYADGSSI